MVQFKKVKKKKLRKKVRVKADDILPLGNEDDVAKDHGSRLRRLEFSSSFGACPRSSH
jgi:hypothetical protein